jgi:hypothetical protein
MTHHRQVVGHQAPPPSTSRISPATPRPGRQPRRRGDRDPPTSQYAADAAALLLLAGLLAFGPTKGLAPLSIPSTLSTSHRHAALLGKAAALLDLGRAADALDTIDLVLREAPHSPAALDARALALERLGPAPV